MPEEIEQKPNDKSKIKFLEETMQEVRLMFFFGAGAMWISLFLCKVLDMKEAFAACAAQLALMFAAICAKAAWGNKD